MILDLWREIFEEYSDGAAPPADPPMAFAVDAGELKPTRLLDYKAWKPRQRKQILMNFQIRELLESR